MRAALFLARQRRGRTSSGLKTLRVGRSTMIATPVTAIPAPSSNVQPISSPVSDGHQRRQERERYTHIGIVGLQHPVIGRMGTYRNDNRREQQATGDRPRRAGKGGQLIGFQHERQRKKHDYRSKARPCLHLNRADFNALEKHGAQSADHCRREYESDPRPRFHTGGRADGNRHTHQRQRNAERTPPAYLLAQEEDGKEDGQGCTRQTDDTGCRGAGRLQAYEQQPKGPTAYR